MGRPLKILLRWILWTVVILLAIFGSIGSIFCIFREISKLPHVSPFARRVVLGSSDGVNIKFQPSSMMAPSSLPQNGPVQQVLGPSPLSDTSAAIPHIGQRPSSPSNLVKSRSEYAPSVGMPHEEVFSPPPIISPPKFEAVPPPVHALNRPRQASAPSDHVSMEHRWRTAISPSIQSQAPNSPFGGVHGISPSHVIPPLAQTGKGMPKGGVHAGEPTSDANASLASPQAAVSSPAQTVPLSPYNSQPNTGTIPPSGRGYAQSPAISPTLIIPLPIRKKRFRRPVTASPGKMPAPAPPVNHSSPESPFPRISPSAHETKMPLNRTHLVSQSQPPHETTKLDGPAPSPTISINRRTARKKAGTPASAPNSHIPSTSHPQSPAGIFFHNPASAPEFPIHPRTTRRRTGIPAFAPLLPPSSYTAGPVMPPSSSDPPAVFPKRRHYAPPPYVHGPSFPPDMPPSSTTDNGVAPAPTPSSFIPSTRNKGPNLSPMLSPSGSFSRMPAPWPQPVRALPPPPPNLDCTLLTCSEPLTNSPPGSPCACVLPIKVALRLGVALYTFFPLVSELALEIASGVSMKQSQVRIMGANAASEAPDKTVVLLDLVPLGQAFDYATALSTYVKFWHKQVIIRPSLYGDYAVLYVLYPGLPPSPPTAPADINPGDETFGNDNGSRTIKPLGVDVGKQKEKLSGSLIAVIVLSSVIALVLCVGAAWLLLLKHRNHCDASNPQPLLPYAKSSGTGPTMLGSRPSSVSGSFISSIATYTGSAKTFGLPEIDRATNGFDDSRIIGEGGFGLVYQGTLEDGTRVAVKVLKRDDQQGGREFLAEVEMLSRLHHRNLVKLIGICTEDHIRCLVYELIPNGSVESHLHGVDKVTAPLDWSARMKVALGAARGLAYLHEDSSPRVIHRDFKSSNILLEYDFTPKVSDFGLARSALEEGNEHISTRVMGTFGYVAPEYAMTGHLLVKSDVYSYGVVLLELLTGRKPVDMSQPPGQENLVAWARPLLTSKEGLEMILDPALGANVSSDSLAKVAAIASMCVQPEVSHRPFMGEVVQALKLVCNVVNECMESGSCSQDDLSAQDPETRVSTALSLESERVLSATDVFSTSARYTREALGSFRRHSSSGPLRTGRSRRILQQMSSGSMSDHGTALRLGMGMEGDDQWS